MSEDEHARGLHLPAGSLGASQTQQQAIHQNWSTLGAVEEELAREGLVHMAPPPTPYPGPITPEQLTGALNKDYTTLYAEHLRWYNYVVQLLARVKAFLLEVENEMSDISLTIRTDLKDKNKLVTKRDDRYSAEDIADAPSRDPRYRELSVGKQRFQQRKMELDAYVECMDRNMKVISRQVEIRKTEQDGERRENSMPYRGRTPGVRGP